MSSARLSSGARKRLGFLGALVALTVLGHAMVAFSALTLAQLIEFRALVSARTWGLVVLAWCVLGLLLSLQRLRWLFHDRVRPRALVVGIQLVYCHFLGVLLAVPLAPLGLAVALPFGVPEAFGWLAYLLGVILASYGVFVRRRWVLVREVEVPLAELPPGLDGLRIAHLSDLHIGSFDPQAVGARWARRVRALKPDLVAVTGDLVTSGTAFYPQVAAVLSELEAPLGVHVILGNHDQWDRAELKVALARRGVPALENEWVEVGEGERRLVVAGLGDPFTQSADLERTLVDRPPGFTLLLSHYPSWARRAEPYGAELMLSGHTHGGQVGLPWLPRMNAASLTGQYPRGLFSVGRMWLYVTSGLGTSGPPIRLGVAPEIALLVLRRA
ncbi:MAG: metallophosphoesterase [Polyangiaceae bacterium]|nr:metallophosphoesterase [Polyangiaceae bacterium]MCW5789018.1 metallophosphoesterase [Polyangiaceae bacterium]